MAFHKAAIVLFSPKIGNENPFAKRAGTSINVQQEKWQKMYPKDIADLIFYINF